MRAQQQRESVILLDTSLSMTYGNRFEAAQKQASAIIDSARSDERLALITFNQGYEIVSRLDADRGKAKTALDAAHSGLGGTDYLQALKGAEDLLRQEGTAGGFKRIFLISDLQASGWREKNSSHLRLPKDLGLALVDVATDESANVTVTNIEARGVVYGVKYPDILTARIANFSDIARPSVEITFQINEQTVEKRDIKLDAQGSATLEFTNFNLVEGANRCSISVNADEFRSDDVFYFTVMRNKPVDALVIETSGRAASESLYIVQALSTGEGLPFTVSVKSSGSIDPSQIGEYGLIILNDVGSMSKQLTDALRNYLLKGGSLIAGVGPHTDAEAFNEAFNDYSPATLAGVIKRNRQEAVAIGDVQLNHPIFQIFKDGGQLSPLRVFGYYKGVPSRNSAVIARFEDGSPAVLEAGVGSGGKFLLYTSTFDATWSDLPLTRLYLPFVQQMARHLIEQQQASSHLLGETFPVKPHPPSAAVETQFPAIDTPGGERLTEKAVSSRGELLVTAREPASIDFATLRHRITLRQTRIELNPISQNLMLKSLQTLCAPAEQPQQLRQLLLPSRRN
ncbi:MAG: VWA domain-containing protein [Pyrinomonadaceae bacterium]